jgi:hypothetical protein
MFLETSKEVKAIPLHTMEEQGGRVGITRTYSRPRLLGGEWSASHPGRGLHPGKGFPVPIGQEARWAPEPVWTLRNLY